MVKIKFAILKQDRIYLLNRLSGLSHTVKRGFIIRKPLILVKNLMDLNKISIYQGYLKMATKIMHLKELN